MSFLARARLALFAACAITLAPATLAQAVPAKLTAGEAQLPTTGLIIDLPPKAGVTYHVSGSWALTGDTFDTRDVIDEIDTATGNVRLGNWVLAGYFNAGDCNATLAGVQLDAAWTQSASLWGEAWSVRGGVFTFDGALGRRSAAILCRQKENEPALLLYHFLANQPETTPQATVMESVGRSAPLAGASRSFTARRAGDIFPTRRADVRNRGEQAPARRVTLPVSGLELDLPDDGYFWLPDAGDGVDFLDRLLPFLPEVTLELVIVPDITCADLFGALQTELRQTHRPLALPAGWLGGPAIIVEGQTELTMCHAVGASALVVGVFQGPDNRDVSDLYPVLGALLAAAQKQ